MYVKLPMSKYEPMHMHKFDMSEYIHYDFTFTHWKSTFINDVFFAFSPCYITCTKPSHLKCHVNCTIFQGLCITKFDQPFIVLNCYLWFQNHSLLLIAPLTLTSAFSGDCLNSELKLWESPSCVPPNCLKCWIQLPANLWCHPYSFHANCY